MRKGKEKVSGRLEEQRQRLESGRIEEDTKIKSLEVRIKESPAFIPSFRAVVPLGLTDDMLELTNLGRQAIPILKDMLDKNNPSQVRKAAVVMLSHVNFREAELLVRKALDDPETRAEALICLGNFFMRNRDGEFAAERRFLRNPDLALLEVLDYIEDETTIILESGFSIYQGPIADLSIAAAVRIMGLDTFADILDPDAYRYIGLIPKVLNPVVKISLKERLQQQRDRLKNLMKGKTKQGTITATEPVTDYTKEIKLSFAPQGEKCACSKIGWIQVAKATMPGGGIGYAAGETGRDTDKDGWLVDQLAGSKGPVYGSGNDAGATIPTTHGQYGKRNGGTAPAELLDKPSGPAGTEFEFESCVFCIAGTDAGKCYGCFKWKCTIKPDGSPSYTKLGATGKPSKQFRKSAKEWNKLPGKTDTPDPAKW